jgi:hypothetical protein
MLECTAAKNLSASVYLCGVDGAKQEDPLRTRGMEAAPQHLVSLSPHTALHYAEEL